MVYREKKCFFFPENFRAIISIDFVAKKSEKLIIEVTCFTKKLIAG